MIKFYLLISIEFLFFPILFIWNELKNRLGGLLKIEKQSFNNGTEIDDEVIYAVHEWAGYPTLRTKTIKVTNKTFTCGLRFQLNRMSSYDGSYKLRRVLTVSDLCADYIKKLKEIENIDSNVEIFPVKNTAMDFSGYSFVCHNLLDPDKEQIVFLTNSSIDDNIMPFIDEYVELFKKFPNLGMVGVSYSSKVYQSLLENNFNLHLQSYFLVTKTSVLNGIIKLNGGKLPGETESYKLSIIRFGEIQITKFVQKLGYKVAVIIENGDIIFFPGNTFWYNGYAEWHLPRGDYRLFKAFPNQISKISSKIVCLSDKKVI